MSARIAVFYDGGYFAKVCGYYYHQHPRRARISVKGLHSFIEHFVAQEEGVPVNRSKIVEASHYRGVHNALQAREIDRLFVDRVFDDALIRSGVKLNHQHLVTRQDGLLEEKRVDVSLSLDAFEWAIQDKFDVAVLITGDGDFVPLIRRLNAAGKRVVVLTWDFVFESGGKMRKTWSSPSLTESANYGRQMVSYIDAHEGEPLVEGLFMPRSMNVSHEKPASEEASMPIDELFEASSVAIETRHEVVGNSTKERGVVSAFLRDKGYGFIRSDSGASHFFHISNVLSVVADLIDVGLPVCYRKVDSNRGAMAVCIEAAPATELALEVESSGGSSG